MSHELTNYLTTLNTWLHGRNLQLSPEKSTSTLFTTWTKEVDMQLNITVNGETLPTTKSPKLLGVKFDPMLTFNLHADSVISKLKTRNNMMKTLAGSNWGKEKETMITTYKAISRPILNYAAPVWTPQLANTHWSKLQVCQNSALRSATGCHLMSSVDQLHQETEILPAKAHNQMLSEQYLLMCHSPLHPCHSLVNKTPPPRSIRRSVDSYQSNIQNLVSTPVNGTQLKSSLNEIHTKTVATTISRYKVNRVLNTYLPPVSLEEKQLPRETRTKLAQLRSGFCRLLNSYMSRLDNTIRDECPLCSRSPHDTNHLFNCPTKPTLMTLYLATPH